MFKIQRLECDGHKYFESPSAFVATLTNEIACLVPNGVDMLTLFCVPISKNMSSNRTASGPHSSPILEIRYPGIEGDRFVNSTKSAINNLTMTFCDEEGVKAFTQRIEVRRTGKTADKIPKAPGTPRKQSIAVIDISSTSAYYNHEKDQTLNTAETSEVDASSPLRDISFRTRQRVDFNKAPSVLKQPSNTMPNTESGEDIPALSKPADPRQLIERLRASQEHPPPESGRSLRQGQGQSSQSPHKINSGEGAPEQEVPSHLPPYANQVPGQPQASDRSSSALKPKRKQPAEPANKSISNQSKKRSKPSGDAGEDAIEEETYSSASKGLRSEDTMARPTGPGQSDSQGDGGVAKTGLKRRVIEQPTNSKAEQSQKPPKVTSEARDFDLPSVEDEDTPPAKKAKTKNTKPPAKATVKEAAEKKKSAVQVAASPKSRRKKDNDKSKARKPPTKPADTTAASSRARRASKTPKYIEDSDDSAQDDAEERAGEEQETEDNQNDDNEEETAEDSYPLSKGAAEQALEASQLTFAETLHEIVDRESTDDETGASGEPPLNDSDSTQAVATNKPIMQRSLEKPEQSAPKKDSPASKAAGKQSVLKDDGPVRKPANKEPAARKVTPAPPTPEKEAALKKKVSLPHLPDKQADRKDRTPAPAIAQQKATPQRNVKRLSETSIPPTSEKMLRKTAIVHFGPQGPANQAVRRRSNEEEVSENGLLDEGIELLQPPELAEDDHPDDSISHASPLPVYKSPEIKETQPRSPAEDDIADDAVAEADDTNDEAPEPNMESFDVESHSLLDQSHDQEASEYVVSEVEEEASVQSTEDAEFHETRKHSTQTFRPQTPLLDDESPIRGTSKPKNASVSRRQSRQSIGVSAMLDDDYPKARKAINTEKLRPTRLALPLTETEEISILNTTLRPASKRTTNSTLFDSTDAAGAVQEAQELNVAADVLSSPPERATSPLGRHVYERAVPPRKEGTRSTAPQTSSNVEGTRPQDKVQVVKKSIQPSNPADSTEILTTSVSQRMAQPMAPPPPPQSVPAKGVQEHNPPRKSWPESQKDKATRIAQQAAKKPSKPIHDGPVRVKKRLTLPLAANDPSPEPDLPPATPASFSTRLDLHTEQTIKLVDQDGDSKMVEARDAPQKLRNGSMTLVNEEESVLGDRTGMWARLGRRQRSVSVDDMSVAVSPSQGKAQAGGRDDQMVGELSARESQRGLLDAIIKITNVSPPSLK